MSEIRDEELTKRTGSEAFEVRVGISSASKAQALGSLGLAGTGNGTSVDDDGTKDFPALTKVFVVDCVGDVDDDVAVIPQASVPALRHWQCVLFLFTLGIRNGERSGRKGSGTYC
jgi:hypothetical protein